MADTVEATTSDGRRIEATFGAASVAYRLPVMAPSPCHVASDAEVVAVAGEVVTVRRRLQLEPGICAQVVTEVVFSGEIDGLDTPPRRLVMEIESAGGVLVDTQSIDAD